MTKYDVNIYKNEELVNTLIRDEFDILKEYFCIKNGLSMNDKVRNVQFTSDGTILTMTAYRTIGENKYKTVFSLRKER